MTLSNPFQMTMSKNLLSFGWAVLTFAIYLKRETILANGPAITIEKDDLPTFSSVDDSNDSLITGRKKLTKIYERHTSLIKGPETPLIDPRNGKLYVLTEDANLVSLTDFQPRDDDAEGSGSTSARTVSLTAKTRLVADMGDGRPLGGTFDSDGMLWVADARLGLTRVKITDEGNVFGDIEIVVSKIMDEDGLLSDIVYANDVDVGVDTGHVYFTDSTDIAPEHNAKTNTWDTMIAFKRDILRGKPSGRLLRYVPSTGMTTVLASGIAFANGVAVDPVNENFVLISETSTGRVLKYYVKGERTGTLEPATATTAEYDGRMTGYPDGATCSPSRGMCYVPIPSTEVPILRLLARCPPLVSVVVRAMLMTLPRWVLSAIKPVRYGGVAEVLPGDENGGGLLMGILQDPGGVEIGMITGVAVYEDRLYLGSLKNDFIGVFDL